MLKNIVKLIAKVNERDIELLCDNDCPIDHLKEAIFQFTKFIAQIEENVKAQQEKAKAEAEAKSSEEPKIEPIQA